MMIKERTRGIEREGERGREEGGGRKRESVGKLYENCRKIVKKL